MADSPGRRGRGRVRVRVTRSLRVRFRGRVRVRRSLRVRVRVRVRILYFDNRANVRWTSCGPLIKAFGVFGFG